MATIRKRTRPSTDPDNPGKPGPVHYQVRYRNGDGAQRSRSFPRLEDAKRFLKEAEADVARGTWVDPSAGQVTVKSYVANWRAHQVTRPSTGELVDSHLRTWVLPHFGARRLGSLRSSDIRGWVKLLEGELAPSTVHTVYGVLRGVLRQAVDDQVIPSTPCVRIRLPKIERPEVIPLTTAQVIELLGVAPDRHRALIIAGAGTGLRQGELLGLQVRHVDFLRRTMKVEQQLVTPNKGAPYIGPPKSKASHRTVPLPQVVGDELAWHLTQWPARDGFLFTNRDGRPIRRNRIAEWMRRDFDRAGLDHATMHDLRHYYASCLIAAGESVKTVQKRLGHASAVETLDTYGHLWPESEESTRSAVDAALAAVARGPSVAHLA